MGPHFGTGPGFFNATLTDVKGKIMLQLFGVFTYFIVQNKIRIMRTVELWL